MNSRHLVLGTAGHIDHGKSALVLALTGTDPDRLGEEKRRGITIELGFADLRFDAERSMSIVDVPGHERFVRHMVAGATGLDAVMLVVAADQGVQPQTREHLEICTLLGLKHGVVALTKCDLVDPELLEVAALEVRELLEGSFLARAPLVPVSARTGQGLDELREELCALFSHVAPRTQSGVPRLGVDRSFVMRGFGTVVTGTLVSGRLDDGAEVEVLPTGRRGRIRALQVHQQQVSSVGAGNRVAVNLQGLDCADVPRGATVTGPRSLATTRRVWARLELLPDAPKKMQTGAAVRFHQGTCDRAGRLRILERSTDDGFHVEIYLDEETVLVAGDRFILRRPAPVNTIGGGIVVDVNPPHARESTPDAFALDCLDPGRALRLRLARCGVAGRKPEGMARELGLTRREFEARAAELRDAGTIIATPTGWVDAETWRATERRALATLDEFHAEEALRVGISREELRSRVGGEIPQESWRRMLEGLVAAGEIGLAGERVSRKGHEVVLSAEDRQLADQIESRFRDGGLDPPEFDEPASAGERVRVSELIGLLVARRVLVRIHDGKLFHSAALDELRGKLLEFARESRTIDVAQFKQLAGITRKNAIPLLEHLDAERATRRVGNKREILDPIA